MTEEFLCYLWKFRLYTSGLKTAQGEAVEVLHAGTRNTDSGPDFFNAKIKIGKTTWAGNVEIHVKSSDWKKHNHPQDAAYDNIILHVVHEDDAPVFSRDGKNISTLVLKNNFDNNIYQRYLHFNTNTDWIPCESQVKDVEELLIKSWLDRLLIERLERKTAEIAQALLHNKHHWEEIFYHFLARNFGFKVNALPFEMLAKSLPLAVIRKHGNSLLQVEALLFGQAGLLEKEFTDNYPRQLKKEYDFLRKKYDLTPGAAHLWKFMRLRPVNFPTIRIAQLASLLYRTKNLFSEVIEGQGKSNIAALFHAEAGEYWDTHYMFDKLSPARVKETGADAVNNIIINTVVPFLFIYGKEKGQERFAEKALQLLEQTEKENNVITKSWSNAGIDIKNAYHSQALIELKNEYCSFKKCLNCNIGNVLLKGSRIIETA